MENYNPYKKTALNRKSLSVPMRELMNLGLLNGKIIDIGCGNGQDVAFLNYLGVDIVGYDKFNPIFKDEELLNDRYDICTCNYVFNVIPDLEEHKQLLDQIKSLADEVYISVRADKKAIKDTWKYIEEYDCWLTPKSSYQRFYDEEMIVKYFGEVEYIINNASVKLFKIK